MTRRLPAFLAFLACMLCMAGYAQQPIWVSPNGSDKNDGTAAKPYATLPAALRAVREQRRLNRNTATTDYQIVLKSGTYVITDPVFLRPEDAGTPQSQTIITAAPREKPVLSGGIAITNWKPFSGKKDGLPAIAKGKVWVAELPLVNGRLFEFRQLWVNGQKAIRAKDRNGDSMNRIIRWVKADESCMIPAKNLPDLSQANGLEMLIHQWWAIAVLRVKSIIRYGDSVQLTFHSPESKIQNEHPWPAPWMSADYGNSAFYLCNALALLDEPGEWYADIAQRKLYYWPRTNENLANASVIAPYAETLVDIQGTREQPVSYISFKGIGFEHTGWLRPSQQGHVPLQAGMYLLDAYKLKIPGTPDKASLENQAWIGRPAAAVSLQYTQHTLFENCRFEHIAATALDYTEGSHRDKANGNLFKDIGGTAIQLGKFSDAAFETHLPYRPADVREVCTYNTVTNNLVTNAANEDWGCVGINAGYVANATIAHNEISDVGYMGICVGWGWTKSVNVMKENYITANKIHHYAKHLYDVAGIYTLSAQPGTVIAGNVIDSIYKAPYAHIPSHWFYVYTDEGTAYVTVKDNWCPSEKFLQNANGPGNAWSNNGPGVHDSIKQNAGLEKAYQYLLQEKVVDAGRSINKEKPLVIEIVQPAGQPLNLQTLKTVLLANKVDTNTIYQWQNHYVVFAKVPDIFVLTGKLRKAFEAATVRVYDDQFYAFDRSRCTDTGTARQWDHILLTANLVADTAKQRQYLQYHATQFEQWPELSKGFCNASFQQLLLYRNGRQLMLIISIPKGESLDKLNPKTTENNPRVNEWNKLMQQYQEGIEGTKPGEVWVFLGKVSSE